MEPAILESALVVVVPEAEALVGDFRALYDPAARAGVPAHITVLYPFVPPAQIDQEIENSLQVLFQAHAAFDFELAEIREFPGVLYLAPKPDKYFRRLTEAVVAQFPAYLPYAGAITDPTPHLTVGQPSASQAFNHLRTAFTGRARDQLPISVKATEVVLLDNCSGTWRVRTTFQLGN
jgi:2'-5' RNA ligase